MRKLLMIFTVIAVLFGTATVFANVELIHAEKTGARYNGRSGGDHGVIAYVKVKNLGYNKSIKFVGQFRNGYYASFGSWTETGTASYIRSLDNNWELWKLVSSQEPSNFVIKYEVNGNTYWDNNNNQDYTLEPFEYGEIGLNTPVFALINQTSSTGGRIEIYVKNLGFHKNVELVYTLNNGATWDSISAGYASTLSSGTELWTSYLSWGAAAQIEYAVKYEVNGQTYWDNNFGENYKLSL